MPICASCGKDVDKICSDCWRCKNCVKECRHHMERTMDGHINGHIGVNGKKKGK